MTGIYITSSLQTICEDMEHKSFDKDLLTITEDQWVMQLVRQTDGQSQRQKCRGKTKTQREQGKHGTWETRRAGDLCETYQEKLGELSVAELLVPLCAEVQADELTVPVEGNVVVHRGLAKDVPHILCSTKECNYTMERRKQQGIFLMSATT